MKVGRQDLLYKWLMDELPEGVAISIRGIPATWDTDQFLLIESGQTVTYGGYKLRDITVNGLDIRQFHDQNGTCQTLPAWVAKSPEQTSLKAIQPSQS